MKELLIDENRGIYIPKHFYNNFDLSLWNINPNDYKELDDPENEFYWDTWQDLLDKASHVDAKGYRWRLSQDGDLFAETNDNEVIFTTYSHLAPALINGDASGLEKNDLALLEEIEAFCQSENCSVVSCEENSFFDKHPDFGNLSGDCLEYIALKKG